MMQFRTTIPIVIILTLVAGIVVTKTIRNPQYTVEPGEIITHTNDDQSQEICYMKEIVGFEPEYVDRQVVVLKTDFDTSTITGYYAWIPYGKDSARGMLSGSIDADGYIDGQYVYLIEGTQQKQQWLARKTSEAVFLGQGQLTEVPGQPMTTLRYIDKEAVSYTTQLDRVPCTDIANYITERAEFIKTLAKTSTEQVESYIRENIATIAPNQPVLGGTWYVVELTIDDARQTANVIYEDGHVQSKATMSYSIEGENVTISNVKVVN